MYYCIGCQSQYPVWSAQCVECRAWNTLRVLPARRNSSVQRDGKRSRAVKISEVTPANNLIIATGVEVFDSVLGGGIVPGAFYLVTGDPGAGKSTMLLQAVAALSDGLYVSSEESLAQIKARADRLGVVAPDLLVYADTDLDNICDAIEQSTPMLSIVDSLQFLCAAELDGLPGSIAQVREGARRLFALTRARGVAICAVCHVTKDGDIAGPKVIEHAADVVMRIESVTDDTRKLRTTKNRFAVCQSVLVHLTEKGVHGSDDLQTA
jgi:DNA repair protein RadA/Sms